MKLNITPAHFVELTKKGYSLDQIVMLQFINEGFDFAEVCKESVKLTGMYHSLIRKALLSETENKITTIGQELIQFVNSKTAEKIIKRKPANTEFDLWWQTYPGTNSFEYKGRKFSGDRSLRVGKDECRLKFDKILIQGEYTATQLIDALSFEILQKKESSIKTGTNKLTFMQNSLTYLNQKSYDGFIELLSKGETIKESEDKYDGVNL
jgi:hypothetical protein